MPSDEAVEQKRKEARIFPAERYGNLTAARMRALIVAMPPHDLLGCI